MYATEELQKFYNCAEKFKQFKKKMSMYGGSGDPSLIFGKFPVTEEEQTALDMFLLKKVTQNITVDTLALTVWVLQKHYGEGKLG